jgi:hypothetical protein
VNGSAFKASTLYYIASQCRLTAPRGQFILDYKSTGWLTTEGTEVFTEVTKDFSVPSVKPFVPSVVNFNFLHTQE